MYKKYFLKGLIFSTLLAFLTACSSDLSDENSTITPDIDTLISDAENTNYIQVNEGVQNVITLISTTDTDLNLIISGADAGKFLISGASLIFKNVPDYEKDQTKYYITIISMNNNKTESEEDFVITLVNLNDNAPVFQNDTNLSIPENKTTLVALDATDADDDNSIQYSIKADVEDANSFEIDGDIVSFKEAPNYEEKSLYKFIAIADDGVHKTEKLFLVNVEDVPDIVPEIANFSIIIPEDTPSDTVIGTVDIITVGDTNISAMVLSGDRNDTFTISLDGNLSVAPDKRLNFDNNGGVPLYQLTLIATNEAGDSNSSDINISLTNIIDEVAVLAPLKASIQENASTKDKIGPINILYQGDSYISSIQLSGTGSELFSVDVNGYIYLNQDNSLDYETTQNYYFKAVAQNQAGDSNDVDVNISVENYINSPFQISKILKPIKEKNSAFGSAVSISGDYIVVGAYTADSPKTDAGEAYLFKKSSNGDILKVSDIKASDDAEGNGFSKSVAISQDYIIIGSPYDNSQSNDAGSAYLFHRDSDSSVSEVDKIEASDLANGDLFGSAVAINGKYIIVSSPKADVQVGDTLYTNAGAVYLYTISSDGKVTNEIKFSADSPKQDDNFGTAISIYGDYIVVTSPNKDSLDDNIGYAYLFKIENGEVNQIGEFYADDPDENNYFGSAISIYGSYILVGSDGADTSAVDAGTAYLFKIVSDDTIKQIAKLNSDDPQTNDAFGKTVSIYGDYMVVGVSTGSSYTFKRESDDENDVTLIKKNKAFDTELNDGFATSVSMYGDFIAVGAYQKDSTATNNQSVYLFFMEPTLQPYIYNKKTYINYDESFNKYEVTDFQVASPEGGDIDFLLEGEDSNSFIFSKSTLNFLEKADYEKPTDVDDNNIYNLNILLKDQNNHSTDFDLDIAVQNREYLDLAKFAPRDIQSNEQFSSAIAISGEYIVASSYKKENNSGEVYLYKRDSSQTITQLARFQSDDPQEGSNFGISLAIDGNYIVVGANEEDGEEDDAGYVYLFKIDDDNVNQIAKFTASDVSENDNFGSSVSISGDYIAVGSPKDDVGDTNTGSAYIFKRESDDENDVTQITKITADYTKEKGLFGSSISISGDYIIVGSPAEDTDEDNAGRGYLFKRESDSNNDTNQIAKIDADNVQADDYFGTAVDIDGDYFIISAIGRDSQAGIAYLFKRNSDDEDDVSNLGDLQADDRVEYDNFGVSVSIDNNIIAIGAVDEDISKDINITDSGAVYIFDNTNQIEKLKADDAQTDDNFGTAVCIDGNYIVAGSTGKEQNSGLSYIFIKDEE